jgi:DNA-binding MarR family transcriptional regulator
MTVGYLIHDIARLMRKRFEQRAGQMGFTRSQWQVMVHLAKNEGIHQAGLAEILEVEPISLVRILDRLEARGLIERRQHPTDRRVWQLYLTAAAHPSLSVLLRIGEKTRGEAWAGVADEDQEHLVDTLNILKANLVAACASPVDDDEVSHG